MSWPEVKPEPPSGAPASRDGFADVDSHHSERHIPSPSLSGRPGVKEVLGLTSFPRLCLALTYRPMVENHGTCPGCQSVELWTLEFSDGHLDWWQLSEIHAPLCLYVRGFIGARGSSIAVTSAA